MCRLLPSLLTVCLLTVTAAAQPLADRVPADAIIYVGWKGSGNLGAAYDGSHTKALVESSDFPQLFKQFLPDLIRKVRATNAEGADALEMVSAIGGPLWRHPSAFYFGGIDLTDPKSPRPRMALLCQAGDEVPQLVARVNAALAKAKGLRFPVTAAAQGDLVIVSTFDFAARHEAALAARREFTDVLAQVHEDPLFSGYVDGDALLQLVDMMVNAGGDADAVKNWPRAREALGLSGLKRVAWTTAFDGADWGTRAFVEAPAPRKGILALLDAKPLPDDLLKAIPKSATLVAAGGFDPSRVLAEVRAAAKAIDPKAAQQLEQGISAGSMMLGANLEKDLIDPIGPHWAMYCAPTVGGNGLLGLTVVNRLDDPVKAERTLGLLEMLANNMIAIQTRKQKDGPRVTFRQAKTADMTVHFLAVPFVSPAWGVRGQHLFVAPFPQVVTAAAAHAAGSKDSILDNEAFVKARARLGGEKASGIQFIDLPVVGADGYGGVLAVARMGLGIADMFGVPAPPMVIPPLHALQPHFTPVAAVSRVDDRGFYYHMVAPFPGAEYFGPQNQAFLGQNAMMISILLPSLNRARETANRVKSASNLRRMAQGMLLWSNENKGQFPPDLATLRKYMVEQDVNANDVFTSPLGDGPAGDDYVYLHYPGLNNAASAEVIIAYDAAALNRGMGRDGTNVLYGDGHVEWQTPAGIRQSVERSRRVEPRSVPQDITVPGSPGAGPGGTSPPQTAPRPGASSDRPAPPLRPRPRPAP